MEGYTVRNSLPVKAICDECGVENVGIFNFFYAKEGEDNWISIHTGCMEEAIRNGFNPDNGEYS